MIELKAEQAWVEFNVPKSSSPGIETGQTGGVIDTKRGIVTALRDITFNLREGDRLGLIGHNGAGKSTMLRLLAGVYSPTRGRITASGRISTLFNATPGLNAEGTARENIVACGLHLGMSYRQIMGRMDEIIDFADLGPFIDMPVRIYSAGMMTRLGFSIATSVEPEILLLDEGLATGDAQFAHKAHTKMLELMDRSAILVIASHSESLVSSICTRCLLLEHGRIVADGAAKELVNSYRDSVVQRARANDRGSLRSAYALAVDMAKRGELPPLELEEQGLRYALKLQPNDAHMWQRYVTVLQLQNLPVSPEIEVRALLASLQSAEINADHLARLKTILAGDLTGSIPRDLHDTASRISHERRAP